jgi:hypothetical protein
LQIAIGSSKEIEFKRSKSIENENVPKAKLFGEGIGGPNGLAVYLISMMKSQSAGTMKRFPY